MVYVRGMPKDCARRGICQRTKKQTKNCKRSACGHSFVAQYHPGIVDACARVRAAHLSAQEAETQAAVLRDELARVRNRPSLRNSWSASCAAEYAEGLLGSGTASVLAALLLEVRVYFLRFRGLKFELGAE